MLSKFSGYVSYFYVGMGTGKHKLNILKNEKVRKLALASR